MFPSVSATSTSVVIPTGGDTFETVPIFLLGDSGYQNTNFLVTTFELAETEDAVCKDLNEHLSSARYKVECTFGQLKCRWRILLRGIELETTIAPDIVYALSIIQNFLIDCRTRSNLTVTRKSVYFLSMKGDFHNHKWNLSLLRLTTCARN
ncbi:Nuclease HARBI1 [Phytophthora megakarya]|uniref:Nuclease HARBI1 n=1 Tax=Phytophthora megakarya TaxID=4795 RepID=A0A225UP21_9STRA|nr:Nuclease HARBI1 [Phytophthora megakarya]